MFKFIRLWFLRYKLAQLFKQAELCAERGIERGNGIYVQLNTQADNLIREFTKDYPYFDSHAEFPALFDLETLALPPEPPDNKGRIAQAIGLFIFAGIGVGAFGAIVFWTYHALTL